MKVPENAGEAISFPHSNAECIIMVPLKRRLKLRIEMILLLRREDTILPYIEA